MYIYTPLCRYWIALYRYVLVFIVPHVDIELEDNKQFISNIPRICIWVLVPYLYTYCKKKPLWTLLRISLSVCMLHSLAGMSSSLWSTAYVGEQHRLRQLKCTFIYTFKLQWLEHLWDHGNLFETWVVWVTEGQSWCQVRKQMVII